MCTHTKLGKIADIITGPFGSQLHMSDYIDEGIPVIMPQNIENRTFNLEQIAKISESNYKRLFRYSTQKNDIIYARRGDVEKHAFITNDEKALCGTGCLRVRVFDKDVFPPYLSFYLDRNETRKWIVSHAVGTNMANLNTSILSDVPLKYPSYNEQVKIVAVLESLEKKISSNTKINDNLYQMAMTEYMHMFFNKKANSKFGNLIVEQPKSTIQVNQAQESEGTIPFFTSGDAILTWPTPLVSGRNIFLNTGGNADVKFYIGDSAYSTDTWCITAKDDLTDYLYLFLQSIKLELNLKFFLGTGLKHLQKPMLKDRPIYIPSTVELKKFNDDVMPLMSMISDNVRESKALTSLRDWLLPMLMNGQATITD